MKKHGIVINRKQKETLPFISAGGISKGICQPKLNTVLRRLSDSQVSLGISSSDMSAIVCTDIAVIETYDIASRKLIIPCTKDCTTRLP